MEIEPFQNIVFVMTSYLYAHDSINIYKIRCSIVLSRDKRNLWEKALVYKYNKNDSFIELLWISSKTVFLNIIMKALENKWLEFHWIIVLLHLTFGTLLYVEGYQKILLLTLQLCHYLKEYKYVFIKSHWHKVSFLQCSGGLNLK